MHIRGIAFIGVVVVLLTAPSRLLSNPSPTAGVPRATNDVTSPPFDTPFPTSEAPTLDPAYPAPEGNEKSAALALADSVWRSPGVIELRWSASNVVYWAVFRIRGGVEDRVVLTADYVSDTPVTGQFVERIPGLPVDGAFIPFPGDVYRIEVWQEGGWPGAASLVFVTNPIPPQPTATPTRTPVPTRYYQYFPVAVKGQSLGR
jgi:hypothetical protein